MSTADELISFVQNEFQLQRDETCRVWQDTIEERCQSGDTVSGLRYLGREGTDKEPLFRFRCDPNRSRLKERDSVLLSVVNATHPNGSPGQDSNLHMVVDDDAAAEEIVLKRGFKDGRPQQVGESTLQGQEFVADRDIVDLRHDQLKCIERMRHDEALQNRLFGTAEIRQRDQENEQIHPKVRKWLDRRGADSSQKEAFFEALYSPDGAIIQGPPGTGKTRLLGLIANALARRGEAVLVTAFTHNAVDNALSNVLKFKPPRAYRVGGTQPPPDGARRAYRFSEVTKPWRGGVVVAATSHKAARDLGQYHFDTVILDEASQVTIPLALGVLMSGSRLVLVGDHKQMPPVILGREHPKTLIRSVFETLHGRAKKLMLNTTYRMNAEICDYPSRAFYGGELSPSEEAGKKRLEDRFGPASDDIAEALLPSHPSVTIGVHHHQTDSANQAEADVVCSLIERAADLGYPLQEIAVVTPYRRQVRLIRNGLAQRMGVQDARDVFVDSVQRIQGQERDIIIVSIVSATPSTLDRAGRGGFGDHHFNVATTRSRVKRIVVASEMVFNGTWTTLLKEEWEGDHPYEHLKALGDSGHHIQLGQPDEGESGLWDD